MCFIYRSSSSVEVSSSSEVNDDYFDCDVGTILRPDVSVWKMSCRFDSLAMFGPFGFSLLCLSCFYFAF